MQSRCLVNNNNYYYKEIIFFAEMNEVTAFVLMEMRRSCPGPLESVLWFGQPFLDLCRWSATLPTWLSLKWGSKSNCPLPPFFPGPLIIIVLPAISTGMFKTPIKQELIADLLN